MLRSCFPPLGSPGNVCGSKASSSAARPSAVSTRDIPQLPRSPLAPTVPATRSAAAVLGAAAGFGFPEQVRSKAESHISGCNRCSSKIRSASLAWLSAQLGGNARRRPENIPTSPCAPIYPPQKSSLSRVTSYGSRRPPLGLHLAWLDK